MSKNIIAAVVIAVVLIGGGAALFNLNTGEGNRTSPEVAAKTASD